MWKENVVMTSHVGIDSDLLAVPRSELLTEYYKVTDIVQSYDPYFLSIKTWSVTLSAAAMGVSFSRASAAPILLVAVLLAVSFWLVESRFKILQLNHIARVMALERYLGGNVDKPSPLIFRSFAEAAAVNAKFSRWRKVMFWPHVAFPHAFFVVIASIAAIWAAAVRLAPGPRRGFPRDQDWGIGLATDELARVAATLAGLILSGFVVMEVRQQRPFNRPC
jgi:hypothetical protein